MYQCITSRKGDLTYFLELIIAVPRIIALSPSRHLPSLFSYPLPVKSTTS